MVEISLTSNAPVVARALQLGGRKANVAVHKVTVDYGYRGLALVRRNASGRPGPNQITGGYKRKMNLRFRFDGSVVVGVNDDRAVRLEKGFHGQDSAGRYYNQKAYPHFGPAADELRIPYQRAVLQAAIDAIGKI